MRNLQIKYQSSLVWNAFLFLLASVFMIYGQKLMNDGIGPANYEYFIEFFRDIKWLFFTILFCSFFILKANAISRFFFVIVNLIVILHISKILYHQFSKVMLISVMIYAIFSFIIYQLLKAEFNEAYFKPFYSEMNLKHSSDNRLEIFINGQKAYLTNWSAQGFFARMDDVLPEALSKVVNLEVRLNSSVLSFKGRTCSRYKNIDGVGIKVLEVDKSYDVWKEYYNILINKGFYPEYLT
jgi:hypothetical protein